MAIEFVCEKCGKPIKDLTRGTLWIDRQAAMAAYEAAQKEKARLAKKRFCWLSEMKHVEPVTWHVTHDKCATEPTRMPTYWISLERISTVAKMLHWTAHLMMKTWITKTNWSSLMFKFAEQVGGKEVSQV